MKFSTRHDIQAPIDFVFAQASDFPAFEVQAMRRGIAIQRVDSLAEPGTGMRWDAEFFFRGRVRKVSAELTRYDPPNWLIIQSASGGVEADFEIEFMQMAVNRTRVRVGLQLSPRTLTSRLFIQSLKFTKNSLNARFARRIQMFGKDVENRFARQVAQGHQV